MKIIKSFKLHQGGEALLQGEDYLSIDYDAPFSMFSWIKQNDFWYLFFCETKMAKRTNRSEPQPGASPVLLT